MFNEYQLVKANLEQTIAKVNRQLDYWDRPSVEIKTLYKQRKNLQKRLFQLNQLHTQFIKELDW